MQSMGERGADGREGRQRMASTGKMMRRDGGWLSLLSGVRGWRLVGRSRLHGFCRCVRVEATASGGGKDAGGGEGVPIKS